MTEEKKGQKVSKRKLEENKASCQMEETEIAAYTHA